VDILIFGGTRFLGRALVEAAIEHGHRVTLFHRGRTGARLFPDLEHVLGDRDGGLDRLDGRRWDAVFDTCGFVPRVVGDAVRRLADRAGHWTFVSTISVYAEPIAHRSDESAALATIADESAEAVTGESYGPLKALCERATLAAFPGRALIARAGLLIGPHDYTDRFPYWVTRIARGGDVLVPGALDQPLQLIDARDAASWLLRMAESRSAGTFNLTGPETPHTLGRLLEACRTVLASDARFVPVACDFLLEQGVVPWSELPLWTPENHGLMDVQVAAARARGLEFRPLADTIRDTLAWRRDGGEPPPATSTIAVSPGAASLTAERERELLAAWAARRP
jgi:2'-hydroxyisoflavone reductase